MKPIQRDEYDLTHRSEEVCQEDFVRLAEMALRLTEELCFGRAKQNEPAARAAMKEMIAFWIERGGCKGFSGPKGPRSERVGNYSVTHGEETVFTVHGVSVAPAALLILNQNGLRNHAV